LLHFWEQFRSPHIDRHATGRRRCGIDPAAGLRRCLAAATVNGLAACYERAQDGLLAAYLGEPCRLLNPTD